LNGREQKLICSSGTNPEEKILLERQGYWYGIPLERELKNNLLIITIYCRHKSWKIE
jgi:hypothetical protein